MRRRSAGAVVTIAFLFVACSSHPTIPKGTAFLRGGTLRVAVPIDEIAGGAGAMSPAFLDPQTSYDADVFELARCCLLRTLLTFGGHPTAQGGAVLRPDLASKLPTVSDDRLTWTFAMKQGLKYGPPLATIEITSADIVRALERTARLGKPEQGGYSQYYSVIQGFDQYAAGTASSIAGAQTPDPHALVLRLTRPTGDLGYRFSLPATAPIPPGPGSAPFGVADGHDSGYGHYLVSSGPYMVKGSEALSFSAPAKGQPRLAGLEPSKITLVRNPSWMTSTDAARPAYVDEIVMTVVGSQEAAAKAVDDGTADLTFVSAGPLQAPAKQIARYRNDATLGRVEVNRRDLVRYISMNLAMAPFDDIHVRKAMNLIIDKAALVGARGGPLTGDAIGHIALDSSEQNLLINYDPYKTPGNAGSVDRAREEMKLSRYDSNHDGLCDAPACKDVVAYYYSKLPAFTAMAPIVRSDAAKIGIQLTLHGSPTFFPDVTPPQSKIPLALFPGWGKDYANAEQFFEPLFASSAIGMNNWTFMGSTPAQLRSWGYSVRSVPSVDDRITDCQSRVGASQLECWTNLDQYMMENVVPWIPFLAENTIQVIPARIANYSYDQAWISPAFEQIALKK